VRRPLLVTSCHSRVSFNRRSYQTAVSLDPNQQDYWNNKGNCERALGDLAAAERSLRKGLQLPPEQVSLLLNLAQVLQDRGETTQVRALAERAVKVRPRLLQASLFA
jgi:protein O-GlcNAc transferase